MATNRRAFEANIAKQREAEYRTADLAARIRYDAVMVANSRSDQIVENKRRERELASMEREMALDRTIEDRQRAMERSAKLAQQEEALVLAMRRKKEEREAKEKQIQRVRESSDELKVC